MNAKTKALIEDAVNAGLQAGRTASFYETKDSYRATEKRLYAYPVLKLKIAADRENIESIREHGVPGNSKSVIRFQKPGVRLTPEEIRETLITNIKVQIAESEHEIETIDKALEIIEEDPYTDIVKYKYFEWKNDDEIATLMSCDSSTVRRNKSRLVGRLAVFLYGVAAVV
jgi:hypothetical protein